MNTRHTLVGAAAFVALAGAIAFLALRRERTESAETSVAEEAGGWVVGSFWGWA